MKRIKSLLDKDNNPCVEVVSFYDSDGRTLLYCVDCLTTGKDFIYDNKAIALDVAQAYLNNHNRGLDK